MLCAPLLSWQRRTTSNAQRKLFSRTGLPGGGLQADSPARPAPVRDHSCCDQRHPVRADVLFPGRDVFPDDRRCHGLAARLGLAASARLVVLAALRRGYPADAGLRLRDRCQPDRLTFLWLPAELTEKHLTGPEVRTDCS